MPTAPPGAPETRDESLTQTVDALPRLSPRSLKDSVEAADAGPGRYLTVEDGGEPAAHPAGASGSSASAAASR